MYARISGTVASTETKTGFVKAGPRQGEPWSMKFARVNVANIDFVDVLLDDQQPVPDEGQFVDWLVEVTPNGGYTRTAYKRPFPTTDQQLHAV